MRQYKTTYSLTAYVTMLPSADGGRKNGVRVGYQPSLSFGNERHQFSGIVTSIAQSEPLQPGQTALLQLEMVPAYSIPRSLQVHDTFLLMEGLRPVAYGIITRVTKQEEPASKAAVEA
jgi:translation elongation factor EF-Tu-like GTPase